MTLVRRCRVALFAVGALAFAGRAHASDGSDAVLSALNRARADPAGFVTILQQFRARMQGKRYLKLGTTNVWITTTEGVAAIDEAIAVLRGTAPLPPLVPNAGLMRAAQ